MVRWVVLIMFLLSPVFLLSQAKKTGNVKTLKNGNVITSISAQAQYSKNFKLEDVYFNRRIDYGGKGEILEVEFNLRNLIDDPQDLYIFVIATYEKKHRTRSSFNELIPERERIRSFVPYPFDLKNFQYPDIDEKGNVKKDKKGKEKMKLVKFPRNPKAGIDLSTGNPYHLTGKKFIITTHLSRYRTNYFFFNEVAIIIFDQEGKPAFRQLYELRGWRR